MDLFMSNPMISVVMPVYNGEKYLSEAIDSILNQTYTDFEFIILNDGSTDKTEEIILSYDDPRIVYVRNKENLRIVKTLNKGIELAKGKYIARMDADDISFPERFEKQIKFMEDHLNVGICGTWVQTFGAINETWKVPASHDGIIMKMIFHSSLMHPTVFIRKSILFGLDYVYDETYTKVEDYALWIYLSDKTEFANVPKILLKYRLNDTCDDRQVYKSIQYDLSNTLRQRYLDKIHFVYTSNELILHNLLASKNYNGEEPLNDIKNWLMKLYKTNQVNKFVSGKLCSDVLADKLYVVCRVQHNRKEAYSIFSQFSQETNNIYFLLKVKLFLKTIMKYLKEKT